MVILDSPAEVASAGAEVFSRAAGANPDLVLALPTGATAVPFYAELARRHRAGELDLQRARAFNLDELVLPAGHPATFRAFMERHAWEHLGLDRARCDLPRPSGDLAAECQRYDQAIEAAGGLDLAVLGLGADGHVAFNLPGQVVDGTHVITLPEELADNINAPPASRPLRAVTLGLGALRASRQVLLMATGTRKQRAVRALLDGPEDPNWPATLLREHPRFDVLLDRAAAG